MERNSHYKEIKPSEDLADYIHSFWTHKNREEDAETMAIVPDSFFKIIFVLQNETIINYFITGLWTEVHEFTIPPKASSFGCRLKILAPEFLLKTEIASLLDSVQQFSLSFMNLEKFDFSSFHSIVNKWEEEFRKIKSPKSVPGNKLRLSQLLYTVKGNISAAEVSKQIFWTNRQINRYMNKYLGLSLKKYMNIQRVYESYHQIREGRFSPEKNFFDQAHFIKEIKKHTGSTPKALFDDKNDRFLQLKNIRYK